MEQGIAYEFNDSVITLYQKNLKKLLYYMAIYEHAHLGDGIQNPSTLSHTGARVDQPLFPNSSQSTSNKPSSSKPVTRRGSGAGKNSKTTSETSESENQALSKPDTQRGKGRVVFF